MCVQKLVDANEYTHFFFTADLSANAENFNKGFILPTLLRQLQSILQQYPDDGQILKVVKFQVKIWKNIKIIL